MNGLWNKMFENVGDHRFSNLQTLGPALGTKADRITPTNLQSTSGKIGSTDFEMVDLFVNASHS